MTQPALDNSPASEAPPAGQGAQPAVYHRLWQCLREGVLRGLRTSGWLLTIMVPISLAVTLLGWLGWLPIIARPLGPVFRLIGLPGETIIAFVTGGFINIYSGIAALGAIQLTGRQVTVLAIVMLISHGLPLEAVVQRKSGTAVWRTVALRLAASFAGAVLLNLLMPFDPTDLPRARVEAASADAPFWSMLLGWGRGMGLLGCKVGGIVIGLMVLQRLLREFGIIHLLSKVLYPLLWLLGLPRRCAFLWIVANTLGLAYGAGVIVEEVRQQAVSLRDAQYLNRSIAICHSLLEDTLLFVGIGAWAGWITFPRLILAALAVWGYRAVEAMMGKRADDGAGSCASRP